MYRRLQAFLTAMATAALSLSVANAAEARRVALVVGQSDYTGGLSKLANPRVDAERMAAILEANGFDVISCDGGKARGCYDLDAKGLDGALKQLAQAAAGAETALAFFAGHGVATPQGNVLAPIDATLDCATGAVARGVLFEQLMAAIAPAKRKLLIVDACRDNPLADACPGLDTKKLAFTRIEAGALNGFLLVTSTQFGQQALDGPAGKHSPFATALFKALSASPNVYFEQVMNEVARATYDATQSAYGFVQIPGKVVGGAAPADCLAGKGCIGDTRMAALADENERLSSDAAGVRNLIADEERARGKPYTAEQRRARVAALAATLKSIGGSTDPLRQEAKLLLASGNVNGGTAKLDAALDADERAVLEVQRVADSKRSAAAASARDLATLAQGRDIAKAIVYLQRASRLDPGHAATWQRLGEFSRDMGRLGEARRAFEEAAKVAATTAEKIWATIGLGDVAVTEGNLDRARATFEAAIAAARDAVTAAPADDSAKRNVTIGLERLGDVLATQGNLTGAETVTEASLVLRQALAQSKPGDTIRQRDLSVALNKKGDVLFALGRYDAALDAFASSGKIMRSIASADTGNTLWQRDVAQTEERIGDSLVAKGKPSEALIAFEESRRIRERIAAVDRNNSLWQREHSVALNKVGDVLVIMGRSPQALDAFKKGLAAIEPLAKSAPDNTQWQRDLAISHDRIADVEFKQGRIEEATRALQTSATIAQRLSSADPRNAQLQRDRSVYLNKIGDIYVATSRHDEAATYFGESLAVIAALAKSDPRNSMWQRDLSVTHNRVGDTRFLQSKFPEAEASFRAGLAIALAIGTAEPGNPGAKADIALSYWRIGRTRLALGDKDGAKHMFETGRDVMAPIMLQPSIPQSWHNYMRTFDTELAKLK